MAPAPAALRYQRNSWFIIQTNEAFGAKNRNVIFQKNYAGNFAERKLKQNNSRIRLKQI
jgi:hypothetical protein